VKAAPTVAEAVVGLDITGAATAPPPAKVSVTLDTDKSFVPTTPSTYRTTVTGNVCVPLKPAA
jgi:hypothetical protein